MKDVQFHEAANIFPLMTGDDYDGLVEDIRKHGLQYAIETIDGRIIEAREGDDLLSACLTHGIDVPYFCWHGALGSVGACRQCAVKVYAGPDDTEGRIVMSCMTPVADVERVAVSDPEAAAFRAQVIEWLMVNHPHDCPVCEEALLPGDDMIGRGDRSDTDGGLHALYIHLKCAGKPLVQKRADDYWAYGRDPELMQVLTNDALLLTGATPDKKMKVSKDLPARPIHPL